MVGKLVFIALVCVSLTQAQGNEVEEAIKNGLNRVNGMYDGALKKINSSADALVHQRKALERKTMEFVIKSVTVQQGTKQALREVAKAMEEKAKEQQKPESVLECIRKTEKNANAQIQTLTEKFKVNMTNLEKDNLAKFQSEVEHLNLLPAAIKKLYEKYVAKIRACKNKNCVDLAVKEFSEWVDLMYADIRKIFENVGNILGNHGKESSIAFRKHMTQVNQIKSDGIRDIKKCVSG